MAGGAAMTTATHAVIVEIVDRYPALFMIFISMYHLSMKTGVIWIILAKPQNVREGSDSKTAKTGSQQLKSASTMSHTNNESSGSQ
jgi:hypothetical protein